MSARSKPLRRADRACPALLLPLAPTGVPIDEVLNVLDLANRLEHFLTHDECPSPSGARRLVERDPRDTSSHRDLCQLASVDKDSRAAYYGTLQEKAAVNWAWRVVCSHEAGDLSTEDILDTWSNEAERPGGVNNLQATLAHIVNRWRSPEAQRELAQRLVSDEVTRSRLALLSKTEVHVRLRLDDMERLKSLSPFERFPMTVLSGPYAGLGAMVCRTGKEHCASDAEDAGEVEYKVVLHIDHVRPDFAPVGGSCEDNGHWNGWDGLQPMQISGGVVRVSVPWDQSQPDRFESLASPFCLTLRGPSDVEHKVTARFVGKTERQDGGTMVQLDIISLYADFTGKRVRLHIGDAPVGVEVEVRQHKWYAHESRMVPAALSMMRRPTVSFGTVRVHRLREVTNTDCVWLSPVLVHAHSSPYVSDPDNIMHEVNTTWTGSMELENARDKTSWQTTPKLFLTVAHPFFEGYKTIRLTPRDRSLEEDPCVRNTPYAFVMDGRSEFVVPSGRGSGCREFTEQLTSLSDFYFGEDAVSRLARFDDYHDRHYVHVLVTKDRVEVEIHRSSRCPEVSSG